MKKVTQILTALLLAVFAVPAMAQTTTPVQPPQTTNENLIPYDTLIVKYKLANSGYQTGSDLDYYNNNTKQIYRAGNAYNNTTANDGSKYRWALGSNTYYGDIIVPDDATTLKKGGSSDGTGTFQCSYITSVSLPSSLTTIEGAAFAKCPYLRTIHVREGNKDFFDDNGVLYKRNKTNGNYDGTYTLVAVPGDNSKITILDNTTVIGNSAFDGCFKIEEVSIPATVTKIGMWAFTDSGIKTIICNVDTPPNVFGEGTSWGFGNGEEQDRNADGYGHGFNNMLNEGSIKVYVPKGTINTYKTDADWKKFTDYEEITIVKETTFEPVDYLRYERKDGKVVGIKQIEITDPNGKAFTAAPKGWTVTGELFKDGTTEVETTVTYKTTAKLSDDEKTVIVTVSDDGGNIPERNGIYTLHIPAGSLVTEDGRECIEAKPTYGIEYAEPNRTTVTHNVQLTILDSDVNYSWSYKKGETNVVYDTKTHVIGEEINGAVENEVVVTNTTITQVTHRYYSTELVYSRVFKNAEW